MAQTFPYPAPGSLPPGDVGSGLFGDDPLIKLLLAQQGAPLGEQAGMPTMGPPGTPWGGLDPTKTTLGGGQPQGSGQQGGGFGDKFSQALNSPLGVLGMNLLSASGPSLQPQSFSGNLGNALNATQKMMLDRKLIESRIGLNKAAALGQLGKLGGSGEGGKPLTELAKLNADLQAGRITQAQFEQKADEFVQNQVQNKFENERKLREEFVKVTQPLAKASQSLAAASTLIQVGDNPISQLAAFISTIKSIDDSTVREGELRAFNSVQGLVGELENLLSQAKGKGFSEALRKNIAETINKLQQPVAELMSGQRDYYSGLAERNKLDPQNITGIPFINAGGIDLSQFQTEDAGSTRPPPVEDNEVYADEI